MIPKFRMVYCIKTDECLACSGNSGDETDRLAVLLSREASRPD
jgi:hypothetical protein